MKTLYDLEQFIKRNLNNNKANSASVRLYLTNTGKLEASLLIDGSYVAESKGKTVSEVLEDLATQLRMKALRAA